MQAHENTAISTALYSPKAWERFVYDIYSLLTRTHLKTIFYHIYNIYKNIEFTIKEKRKKELKFLQALLKQKIFLVFYRNSTHTDQNRHYNSLHQTISKKTFGSSFFNRTSSIITNKDYCYK